MTLKGVLCSVLLSLKRHITLSKERLCFGADITGSYLRDGDTGRRPTARQLRERVASVVLIPGVSVSRDTALPKASWQPACRSMPCGPTGLDVFAYFWKLLPGGLASGMQVVRSFSLGH